MGQKVNPIGFRLAVTKDWRSKWYATGKDYATKLHEDLKIRKFIKDYTANLNKDLKGSSPAISRINESCISELLLLDTIPYPKNAEKSDKISYISTAPVFAEAIRRIYEETSISTMFEEGGKSV